MKNDADSTVLYTSEWRGDYIEYTIPETGETILIPTPVYGRNSEGELRPKSDTITAATLA